MMSQTWADVPLAFFAARLPEVAAIAMSTMSGVARSAMEDYGKSRMAKQTVGQRGRRPGRRTDWRRAGAGRCNGCCLATAAISKTNVRSIPSPGNGFRYVIGGGRVAALLAEGLRRWYSV